MRYKLKTTDQFWADFQESADYIAHTLENPIAAERLLDELVKNAKTLTEFPKASKPYFSPPEVSETYYALPVKNYFAFYVVRDGVVEFRRFLYSRSSLSERLK